MSGIRTLTTLLSMTIMDRPSKSALRAHHLCLGVGVAEEVEPASAVAALMAVNLPGHTARIRARASALRAPG